MLTGLSFFQNLLDSVSDVFYELFGAHIFRSLHNIGFISWVSKLFVEPLFIIASHLYMSGFYYSLTVCMAQIADVNQSYRPYSLSAILYNNKRLILL